MRRTLVAVALAVLVSTAGCAAFGGGDDGAAPTTNGDVVESADDTANASNVTQSVQLSVNESAAGSEWESLSASYPRDEFTVHSVQHEDVTLGVDTDGDGELEREFTETHVSGVNTNEYSFTLELDTDYTLQDGDVVVVEYPAVDNPDEAGDYTVEVRLNEAQTANSTLTVE